MSKHDWIIFAVFALSVFGGTLVVVAEFSSPHPPRLKQTKPWLDRQ